MERCAWTGEDPLMIAYHDEEWGVPVHDDSRLFEFLLLGGAQAGLGWSTILKKRENYRSAFCGFDPEKVSRFGAGDIEQLLLDEGIVRNRRKIEAAVLNARAAVRAREELGSLDALIWSFTEGRTIRNEWRTIGEIPTRSRESEAMSKELRKRGFRFVGPTICYAFMQAVGMVNDHTMDCFRHAELAAISKTGTRNRP